MDELEEYYTVRDVMRILKRSRSTVFAYIYGGLLKARKLKNGKTSKLLITKDDLESFIKNGVPAGYYQNTFPRPHKVKENDGRKKY